MASRQRAGPNWNQEGALGRGTTPMNLRMHSLTLLAVSYAMLTSGLAKADPAGEKNSPEAPAVIAALRAFYAALQSDDAQAAERAASQAFYAYDGGVRYTADGLAGTIREARARGASYEWNLSEFDVHVSCDQAWLAYRNTGGVRDDHGFTPVVWLESAALVRTPAGWKVRFLHASRAKAS
jgi:hypothetical protein